MSTSGSDDAKKKSGVGDLFKRALETHKELDAPRGPQVEEIVLPKCKHCGAAREAEALFCTYCGKKL